MKKKRRKKKSYSKLIPYIKKQTSLPAKVCLVKDRAFPVATYGWDSWTIMVVGHQELMSSNCDAGESLGQQGDQTSLS